MPVATGTAPTGDYNSGMVTRDTLKLRRNEILGLAKRHGAHDIRVFGSVARGEATDASDLDLLVRLDAGRSLLDLGGLVMDLRDLLGIKVDVVSEGSLYGRFGQIVRQEAVPL
jgi:predicted nucleotidyltransferase